MAKYKPNQRRSNLPAHFVNQRIRAPEVRLIDENGENVGIVKTREAMQRALDLNLDLVEISEKANPPVAKILEYSKFLYDERKKKTASKVKAHKSETKEFVFGPTIGDGDVNIRIARTKEFLEDGNKVKVSVKFKGREKTHPEIGLEKIKQIVEALEDVARIEESDIRLKGNLITVTFVKK